ncbi:DMT family transporter [Paenibacillus physcomitrellae]|uniref:Transporter YvbV n=1 Tax=Paenibacillus physcomitrellae TaxID=1619311 RepID=A0ABQ1GP19_9BACL|nr:DMT family transporter [Paenibacillus physcomitrellae]GGA47658.1 putative transporter YvbV [Paenibacillus physcomitrellae]
MGSLSKRQTALYLTFLIMVWAINWPLSKLALAYTPPVLFAAIRTFFGGILLVLFALPNYRKLKLRRNWPTYLIAGILNITLYYGLQTVGLGYMPAGIFSAIVFLQPVLLGICSWLWLGESMSLLKMAGLLLGFCGVGVISAGGISEGLSVIGILLALASAVSWCLGTVFIKKTGDSVDIIWMTAVQLLFGSLFLFIWGGSTESFAAIDWNPAFIGDLLFISVFVIAIGWFVFFRLVQSGEASKVGSFTFLIPLLALCFSALFMHEQVSLRLGLGMVLVLASILLVNVRLKGRTRKPDTPLS